MTGPRADDESRISICDQWAGKSRDNPFTRDLFPEHDIELKAVIGQGTANLIFKAQQDPCAEQSIAIKTPSVQPSGKAVRSVCPEIAMSIAKPSTQTW